MYRMTHEKTNGKAGYWSPNKKEEVVNRLATYENTGLEPRHVQEFLKKLQKLQLKSCEDIEPASKEFLDECREVAKKYEKKNDGWIPVKDRLPEIFGKYWATIRYDDGRISEPVVVDFRGTKQKYVVDTPNGREYETWGIDSAFHGSRVIAWRPYYIPDPYRPERRNEE